jgi:CheY-like chemotaxis protein
MARIALIERRPDLIAMSRAVLVGRGHAVESYVSSLAAFRVLREQPPDAVIAGACESPAPSARDMIRDVRSLGPRVLAFLLVPGRGDERALMEGLDAGADDVITTPFSATDLAGRVAAALIRTRVREAPTRSTEGVGRSDAASEDAASDTDLVLPRPNAPPLAPIRAARPGGPTRRDLPNLSHAPPPSTAASDEDDVVPDAPALSAARLSQLAALGEEDKLVGRAFDRYLIEKLLGVGGMGIVIQARHARTGRQVALKILREDVSKDRDSAMRFLREAYVLQGIDDRNVVRIEDIGRQGGRIFYAMELVPGENLAQKLDREGKLSPAETCRIGAGIARALAALARRGVVHRDVKPGNVFLGLQGEVKLGDFGLAKRAFARDVTPLREPLGTPHYLAPEVVSGASATPLSDLYSLGVVIHEMLSGQPPFDGRDTMVLLYRICHGPPPEIEKTLAHTPPEVRLVVAKTLARDPKARFPDAAALARSLERLRVRLGP